VSRRVRPLARTPRGSGFARALYGAAAGSEIQRQSFRYTGPSLAMAVCAMLVGQLFVGDNKLGRVAPLMELDRADSFPDVSCGRLPREHQTPLRVDIAILADMGNVATLASHPQQKSPAGMWVP